MAQYDMSAHYSEGEVNAAIRLVEKLLENQQVLLSVNDGEEWVVRRSRNKEEILNALGSTGEDLVRAFQLQEDQRAPIAGSFHLVWGNASDGSELIADMTANAFCEQIDEALSAFHHA